MRAEQLTGPCAEHGEGPVWDAVSGRLRWVDMMRGDVLTLAPGGDIERQHVAGVAAALRPRLGGGLVVATERGFVLLDEAGRAGPERTAFTDPRCRMNDGGTDRQGRFLCGSMAYDMTTPCAALYRLDPGGAVAVVLEHVTISNGIAWSPGGEQMYYIDSATQRVDACDYETHDGTVLGRRHLVEISPELGMPDGLALDAEGGIWVALWRGHAVHRYGPGGRLDAVLELPASQVTACAFGGPDLAELYITTSRMDLPAGEQPAAGSVFRADPGVRGLPVTPFAG
jgi:sugar lactone lactonase YvrE